jgi:hypothetical protein
MGVNDLVDRFPLTHVSVAGPAPRDEACSARLRLFPLQRRQRGFDSVILAELGLDVIVDVLELLLKVLNQLR